jgi:hypothetical protein
LTDGGADPARSSAHESQEPHDAAVRGLVRGRPGGAGQEQITTLLDVVVTDAGQSWYERPGIPHLVSRNASSTKPAKLLVWLLLDKGQPLLEPLPVSANTTP